MATHSSILVWIIPCTREPGGLQCMTKHFHFLLHEVMKVKVLRDATRITHLNFTEVLTNLCKCYL